MENLKLYIIIAVVLVFLSVVIVFFGDEIEKLPHLKRGIGTRRFNGLLDFIYILIFAIASLFGIFLVIGNKIIKFLSKGKEEEEEEEWGEEDENKEEENEKQALDINLDVNFKNSRKIISAILIFIFVILPIIFITICIIDQFLTK